MHLTRRAARKQHKARRGWTDHFRPRHRDDDDAHKIAIDGGSDDADQPDRCCCQNWDRGADADAFADCDGRGWMRDAEGDGDTWQDHPDPVAKAGTAALQHDRVAQLSACMLGVLQWHVA